ncbi:twin-arginine translocase TatA/TatE family subunit [Microbacterium sp.]|uniref:twin-arginine translocase TatA/TatE family subunit n=1 Tax=Microbacterium sp. TaxID=51671 RepID=UPI0039E3F861
MLQNLTGWHALIILAIVVLIFGAAKLPALAKSVGQSMRILRAEAAEPAEAVDNTRAPASAPGGASAAPIPDAAEAGSPAAESDRSRSVVKVAE